MTCTSCGQRTATRGELCKPCNHDARMATFHERRMGRLLPYGACCRLCRRRLALLAQKSGQVWRVDRVTGKDHAHSDEAWRSRGLNPKHRCGVNFRLASEALERPRTDDHRVTGVEGQTGA